MTVGHIQAKVNYEPKAKYPIPQTLFRDIKNFLLKNCTNNSFLNFTTIVRDKILEQGTGFHRKENVLDHTIFECQNRMWGKQTH